MRNEEKDTTQRWIPNRVLLLYEIPVDGNLATLYNYLLSRGRSIIRENIGSALPDVDNEMV